MNASTNIDTAKPANYLESIPWQAPDFLYT